MMQLLGLRGAIFGVCISVMSRLLRCSRLRDFFPDRDSPLRPPAWVFGVVWPCLYVATGAAWSITGHALDVPLGAVTLLCCAWLVAYRCLRHGVLAFLLLVCTVLSAAHAAMRARGTAQWLLLPLCAWTAFAAALSAHELRTTESHTPRST